MSDIQDDRPTLPAIPPMPPLPQLPQQTQQTQPMLAYAAPPAQAAPAPRGAAGRTLGVILAAALVGGAAGLGGAYAGTQLWATGSAAPASAPAAVTVNNPQSVTAITGIAAKAVPSVVTIQASSGSQGGTGSGVVLTADGYVVTNTHVVTLDGATGSATLSVTTADGHVYAATVVGTDPTYDLAVIKLKGASGLTPIQFGDSAKLNVGDQTVAVGAPLGLSNTVTNGIVSALNRSIEIASSAAPNSSDGSGKGGQGGNGPFRFDFGQGQGSTGTSSETIKIAVIQTDAAINPGNSGGALVNSAGQLIGINVAIASAGSMSGGQSGSIGVGFSIPSNIVKRITDQLMADGKATHGLLGASVQDAGSLDGATIEGAAIAQISAGGAADKAGLQKGDIITAFDGVPITGSVDLTAQVRAAAAGSQATVTYVRGGRTATVTVTLGALK